MNDSNPIQRALKLQIHLDTFVCVCIYIYRMEYLQNRYEYDQTLFYGIYTRFLVSNVEAIKKFAYLKI